MMTCRELTDFLSDYVGDELPQPVRRRFKFHLWMCRNCWIYVSQFRETVAAGKRVCDDAPVDGPIPEEVVQAIMGSVNDNSTQNGR